MKKYLLLFALISFSLGAHAKTLEAIREEIANSHKTSLIQTDLEIPTEFLADYQGKYEEQHGEVTDSFQLSWLAVAVIGIYTFKKALNKWTSGTPWANTEREHSHLIQDTRELQESLAYYRFFIDEITPQASRNISDATPQTLITEAQNQILDDALALSFSLVRASSEICSHDHHDCSKSRQAQKALVKSFPGFLSRLAKDFYTELIHPVKNLLTSVKDPMALRQIKNFLKLATVKNIYEQGPVPAAFTGTFVVLGQGVAEAVESLVMPAGAHFFCHVGNTIVVGIAATAYATYFCLKNMKQIPHLSTREKVQTFRRYLKTQWRDRRIVSNQLKQDSLPSNLSSIERLLITMKFLQYSMEKQLQASLNLSLINSSSALKQAKTLGRQRKQLNTLSYKANANIIKPSPNIEGLIAELSVWLEDTLKIQGHLPSPSPLSCRQKLLKLMQSIN